MQNLLEKLGLGERATSMVVWVGLSLLLLIVVVALAVWLVRTLRPTLNLSGGSARGGRPQRLAITDAFTLDRDGRKLVIVRRDNVEHLLLIGGPNDVLVESSIVRGERATRDRTGRGTPDSDLLAAETALAGDLPAAPVAPQATIVAPPPAPVAPAAPPVFRPAAQPVAKPPPAAPRLDDEFERALNAMQNAQRQQAAASPPPPPAPPPRAPQPAPAPAAFTPPPPPIPAPPPPAPPLPPVMAEPVPMPPPPPSPATEPPPRAQPMSEMARRLNEVLQKPLSGTLRPPFNKPIPPVPGTMNSAPKPVPPPPPPPVVEEEIPLPPLPPAPPPPPPVQQAPASPAPAADKPGSDHEMDLLEEEMARLLGRPSQPKKPDAT